MNEPYFSLLATFLGIVITAAISWVTFRAHQKTDFRRLEDKLDNLHKLPAQLSGPSQRPPLGQPVEDEKLPKLPLGLEGKIIAYFEKIRRAAQAGLESAERKVDIYNFEQGWGLLFDDTFISESQEARLLRDLSISSHGEISFGGYDFPGYVEILKAHLLLAGDGHSTRIRVLILCNSDSESRACNIAVEKHLQSFLDLKFPHLAKEAGSRKLREWKEAARRNSDLQIEIRLIGKSLADSVHRSKKFIETPFNVYGAKAVSRSIVKANNRLVYPVPHLEISLNKKVVEDYTEVFDDLWDEAAAFQEKLFAKLTDQDMERIGSGDLLKEWSSL